MPMQRPKKVNVKLLQRDGASELPEPYRIMDELVAQFHTHLAEAKIAIAWRHEWAEDVDGRLQLGQCRKGTDLDRQLHEFDFVILLNWEAFNLGRLDAAQQRAILDHELCHAEVAKDSEGNEKHDKDGRIVYRTRKHDVEEFIDVVGRHGLYTHTLAALAQQGINDSKRGLLKDQDNESNDEETVTLTTRGRSATVKRSDVASIIIKDAAKRFGQDTERP